MGWIEDLHQRTVALDTAPVISFIAEETPYIELVRPVFQAIARGDVQAVTSMITLAEVLVHPLREKDSDLAARYKEILLHSENLTVLALSEEVALKTAEMRATYGLRMPDAIQVATALVGKAQVLITNDKRLRVPTELKRVVLDDLLIPHGNPNEA
jgi:predicted nucleic acid-binding protein